MPADFGDGFASERPDGTRRIPLGLESGVALPLKLLCEEPALGTAISLGDGQDSACKMLPRSTETDGGEIARGSGAPRNTVPRWGPRKACGRLLTPAVGAWSPRWAASDLFFAGSATTERQHAEDPHFRTASRCPGEGRARRSAVRIASPASPAQDPSDPRLYIIRHHFALRTQRKATELLQVWCVRCF